MIVVIAIVKIKSKFKIKMRAIRANSIISQKIKNYRNEKQNCEK